MKPLLCTDSAPTFLGLFDLSIAPPLLFYVYIPVVLIALFSTIFILVKDRCSLQSKLLFLVAFFFSLWVTDIIILWTAAPVNLVMFFWQLLAIFEIPFYVFTFYFLRVFIDGKDISFNQKLLLFSPIFTTLALLPTTLNISAFNIDFCEGIVGPLWIFIYSFQVIILLMILGFGIRRYHNPLPGTDPKIKKQLPYILAGSLIFLGTFTATSIIGDLTGLYDVDFVGPLGMVIFFAYFTYTLVRFKSFGIKMFGVQALVYIIWILVGSILFLDDPQFKQTIVLITLLISIPLGILVIRGVQREIKARQEIERLAKQLEDFISFATHELRGPLTNMKAALSMIINGEYGEISKNAKDGLKDTFVEAEAMTHTVDTFLNINKIEAGGFRLDYSEIDITDLINDSINKFKFRAESKNIKISAEVPGDNICAEVDYFKLSHVINNLIDNALKYTPEGGLVTVSLQENQSSITIHVTDTGVGMDQEVLSKIFSQYERGRTGGVVAGLIEGHGIGLWLTKHIVETHGGKISATSEGEGKGSTFAVQIPKSKKLD